MDTRKTRGEGFFSRAWKQTKDLFSGKAPERERDKVGVFLGFSAFFAALLFARCHLVFGAYPLALAFLCALPVRVVPAFLGAAAGALSLGKAGIVYAMISLLVVFLRIVISGEGKSAVFRESPILRTSVAVIGGFVAGVYEVLLSGFSLASLTYGIAMTVLPGAVCFLFSGLFGAKVGAKEFLLGKRNFFTRVGDSDKKERLSLLWFCASALAFLFFLTYSLRLYSFFGIDACYLFAAFATLFVARRFGALFAMAAGFCAVLGVSDAFAVAFALAGLGAGLLFRFGAGYALAGGGLALAAWSAYAGGLPGLLTAFPEYAAAAIVFLPLSGKLRSEGKPEAVASNHRTATDMVGTMALAYRDRRDGALDALESAFSSLAPLVRRFGEHDGRPGAEEYKALVYEATATLCRGCGSYRDCESGKKLCPEPVAAALAEKLYRKEKLSPDDLSALPASCGAGEEILAAIRRAAARLEEEKYRARKLELVAEDYEMLAKIIAEARDEGDREHTMDEDLTEKLEEVFFAAGFSDGVIRAFGDRRKYVLAAGEDRDGDRISAPALREGLARATGVKLGKPTYYRRGGMVLLEVSAAPSYTVEVATASLAGESGEISGDTLRTFESEDGKFFALLSDGMGSGEVARETSAFVGDLLSALLSGGVSKNSALALLNRVVRRRSEECSATVDLFELDRITGEASFLKSGAAPSYIKRGESLFRLRSQTVPIGLLPALDAERIRCDVQSGDYLVMLSDGVSSSPEDAPWLIDLLSKPAEKTLQEFADAILSAAVRNTRRRDDMSVVVLRVATEN